MRLELNVLLEKTEDQFFDRKSARIAPKDILKEIVGFANADGGTLVVGIEDNGEITGFLRQGAKKPEQFLEAIRTLLRRPPLIIFDYLVPIENASGQQDHILVLDIELESNRVVENYDGEAYLRINDKTVRLNYEERRKLEFDKGQRYFEDEEVRDSSLSDIDMEIFDLYRKKMGLAYSNIEDVLNSRKLLRNGHLTTAGLLLFGKDPSVYLPGARLKFLRYEGTVMQPGTEFNLVKEVSIVGSIPKIIVEAEKAVHAQLREFQYLDSDTGQFKAMPEYPKFAWFEGIVNAVTHRDYSYQGDYIRVSMFDDRLEIFSPGKLPNFVTLENMKFTRFSRNPKIARTLSEFGWVKELNEGVKRIYSEMERFFLGKSTPEYSEPHGHAVLLSLRNNILNRHLRAGDRVRDAIDETILKTLNENERIVLQYTYMTGRMTVREAAELMEKSPKYASTLLKGLVRKGLLKWHGTSVNDPTQYYTFFQR
jgi:ATP-dependent DNA helicase RecG